MSCIRSRRVSLLSCCFAIGISFAFFWSRLLLGQGVLVIESDSRWRLPRPHPPIVVEPSVPLLYRVKNLDIDSRIVQSVARVQMSQTFVNEGSRTVEARCVMPLPPDVAVDGLTFMVDGKEIEGKLMSADEAKRIYQSYVRKSQDPALVQWIGNGLIQTNVFPIPPGAERTVSIGYTHVLRKVNGSLEWSVPIKAAGYSSQPIEKVSIRVYLEEGQKLGNIYSPTHSIDIKRSSEKTATIEYKSKLDIPQTDFRLLASTTQSGLASDFIGYKPDVNDQGYFLMLLHPQFEAKADDTPKDIVLVLDKSGSMRGEKMEQARQALLYVLKNLPKKDRVGIVVYDSQVLSFRDHLIEASNHEWMESAKSFVQSLSASGSTNIDQGLEVALKLLQSSDRPSYIVHLSDGIPTVGERDDRQIAANVVKRNKVRTRLFNFGVGHDVHSRLMNRLSTEGFGQTFFVSPEENIEGAVSTLYDRLGQPALSDVRWEIVSDRADKAVLSDVYPTRVVDLFSGDQTSIAGRFRGSGKAILAVTGKLGKTEMRYEQTIDFDSVSTGPNRGYIATLWASRRAAGIIDEIDLEGKKESLINELIMLAKKYGVMTPYTSFLAEEPTSVRTASSVREEAFRRLGDLSDSSGQNAFERRRLNAIQGQTDNLALNEKAQSAAMGGGFGGTSRPASPAYGLGGGGASGGVRGLSSPPGASLSINQKSSTAVSSSSSSSIRRVGDRVFFLRNGQWIDSRVGDNAPSTANKVDRFSDAYFAIVEKHASFLEPLLDLQEPIVVELDGNVYIL